MAKALLTKTFQPKKPKNRPGIVSKRKSSSNPNSKTYLKRYRGQGR